MNKVSDCFGGLVDTGPSYDHLQPPLGEPIHLTQLTYKRIKNLGNYESETLEATAIITVGEDPKECYETLKDYVEEQLGLQSIRF